MNMDAAAAAAAAPRPAAPADAPATAAKQESHGMTFHELLSSLNPLQHIPLVGTIYRAVTGNEIPEAARNIGSIAIGGLMGGPVGLAGNVAFIAFRKLTGIDIDQIGQGLLADIGIGHHAIPEAAVAAAPAPAGDAQLGNAGTRTTAWSAAQLRAYGVDAGPDGSLRQGSVSGSDVLNGLLLAELRPADGTRPKDIASVMAMA